MRNIDVARSEFTFRRFLKPEPLNFFAIKRRIIFATYLQQLIPFGVPEHEWANDPIRFNKTSWSQLFDFFRRIRGPKLKMTCRWFLRKLDKKLLPFHSLQ